MLFSKETFLAQARKIVYAIFPRGMSKTILRISSKADRTLSGFISGKLLDSLIIGILCFIGMLILGMAEHALLVSCIVAVTAFIPIFGPIVGALMGALFILIVDPMMALWFLVFIIVLQQLESHIVYPKIMGHHVDLPGILVITAVTVGGGLFGVPGIILSVPLCSVIYTLFDQWMVRRLEAKNICHRSMSSDSAEPKKLTDDCEICDFDKQPEECTCEEENKSEE